MSSAPSGAADCIFCKIVAGTIPAETLAESDRAIAFRDLAPVGPTHALVIPRRHLSDATELDTNDGELLAEMFTLANSIAASEGIAKDGYRLVMNVGTDGGNTVPHLHLHLIGGRPMAWPPG